MIEFLGIRQFNGIRAIIVPQNSFPILTKCHYSLDTSHCCLSNMKSKVGNWIKSEKTVTNNNGTNIVTLPLSLSLSHSISLSFSLRPLTWTQRLSYRVIVTRLSIVLSRVISASFFSGQNENLFSKIKLSNVFFVNFHICSREIVNKKRKKNDEEN